MDLIGKLLSAAWGYFKRALGALGRLHFADIWNFIKRIFDRVHRLIDWYNKHVIQPWERLRAQLIALYNKYLGPIVKMLDTVRAAVRILAVFDRKLAAKIDSALWNLESKLYAPLYAALTRINAITSTMRAMITPLGLLDRSLLVQSIERDWKSIWRVLLNNGKLPTVVIPGTAAPAVWRQITIDWQQYRASGTGPFADTRANYEAQWRIVKTELT